MTFDRMESATYLASQLAKGFSRSLQQRATGLGFSPGQFPVLVELWSADGLTQKQLLAKVDVEQATLANTLARMERDGLIERQTHPTDKRAQIILLTDQGRALEAPAIEAALEADDALFAGFRRFERELLMEFMRRATETARKL
jgi:DNA-binding MarR family transcriptional regulator